MTPAISWSGSPPSPDECGGSVSLYLGNVAVGRVYWWNWAQCRDETHRFAWVVELPGRPPGATSIGRHPPHHPPKDPAADFAAAKRQAEAAVLDWLKAASLVTAGGLEHG